MPHKSSKNIGPRPQITGTCEQLELFNATSLPGVFPASHTVLPGSAEAQKTTVTSGRQCGMLLDDVDQLGFVVRTSLESSAWNSTKCFLTRRALAIGSNRLLFRLVPSMPRTAGIESGLWQTPVSDDAVDREAGKVNSRGEPKLSAQVKLWPTPTEHGNYNKAGASANSGNGLATAVTLLPTPRATDGEKGGPNQSLHGKPALAAIAAMFPTQDAYMGQRGGAQHPDKRRNGGHKVNLEDVCGGRKLNPEFVEYLMGYPIGHTALEDWVTPSSRRSPKSSSKPSTQH